VDGVPVGPDSRGMMALWAGIFVGLALLSQSPIYIVNIDIWSKYSIRTILHP
jgi:hypothetical protein